MVLIIMIFLNTFMFHHKENFYVSNIIHHINYHHSNFSYYSYQIHVHVLTILSTLIFYLKFVITTTTHYVLYLVHLIDSMMTFQMLLFDHLHSIILHIFHPFILDIYSFIYSSVIHQVIILSSSKIG
jgi:hypothetical protein